MKLKSSNRYISFFILLFSFLPINAEEEIDIWNKNKKKNSEIISKEKNNFDVNDKNSIFDLSNQKVSDDIKIQGEIIENGPTSQIINNPKNTYTKSLISSVYDLEI